MTVTVMVKRLIDVRCPICDRLLCRAAEGSLVQAKCRHHDMMAVRIGDGDSTAVNIRIAPRVERDTICPVAGMVIDA